MVKNKFPATRIGVKVSVLVLTISIYMANGRNRSENLLIYFEKEMGRTNPAHSHLDIDYFIQL